MTEVDAADLAALDRLFKRVEPWMKRTDPANEDSEPESGSSLDGDNKRTHPYELSHVAWHALMSSVHRLDTVRRLVHDAGTIPLFAGYSLVRSSLEAASTAVWLLQPTQRRVRVRRRLKLAAHEARNQDEVAAVLAPQSRQPLKKCLKELKELGNYYNLDPDDIGGRWSGSETIIKDAAKATGVPSDYPVAIWQLCSGVAHGLLWASLRLMDREEIRERAGVVGVKLTPGVSALVTFTSAAVLTAQCGWELYDTRSHAPHRTDT